MMCSGVFDLGVWKNYDWDSVMAKSGVRVGDALLACVGDRKSKQPNGINQCVVEVR